MELKNQHRIFFAHSENAEGKKHELAMHLESVSSLACKFTPSNVYERLFYLAGLLHDVGKFQDGFQLYLETGKPRTPHAAIGAHIARSVARDYMPLPFVIKGHHAGMPDKQDLINDLKFYEEDGDAATTVLQRFQNCFPDLGSNAKFELTDFLTAECLTRFLFSALTDADWLDTERHFSRDTFESRGIKTLDSDRLLDLLKEKFDQLSSQGKINELRTEARNEAANKFDNPLGFFSLQLPTGLGKTLTSVYWAILHARRHKLKRIIIVLPYINIIDQTALILKGIFGDDFVLEHHSGIIEDDNKYSKEESINGQFSTKYLACENWDAPIIVTTSAQFFDSLFSNKPFKCRKNHNISDSVVIFDEIQTLPKHLAEPTIVMLKNIKSLARTSFLFCTATLPAFVKREGFDGIEEITPLIAEPKKYFDAVRRVEYKLLDNLSPIESDVLAKNLLTEQCTYLVIVNTKAVAKDLYQRIAGSRTHERFYHLSTAMCPHHRKEIIKKITEDLENRQRIAVFSTQLIEAGVDFDFPCVYRAIAPLDAIIQSAGRCNRNGEPDGRKGKVVIFKLKDQKMPDNTYKSCAALTEHKIRENSDILHQFDSFESYYKAVTDLLVHADKFKITEERKNFNFKTVNQQYHIIDKVTIPLFIACYSDESSSLLVNVTNSLKYRGYISREQYRNLQQYSVQVYPDFLSKYDSQIEMLADTIYVWHGKYDPNVGLNPEDIETVF